MQVGPVLAVALCVLPAAGCAEQGPGGSADSGVTGRVHLGPRCPVERPGQPCPDAPARGAEVTLTEVRGRFVASTSTDSEGRYRIAVAPGRYVVTADAGMSCETVEVGVRVGELPTVDLVCDTGIR